MYGTMVVYNEGYIIGSLKDTDKCSCMCVGKTKIIFIQESCYDIRWNEKSLRKISRKD